MSGIMNMFVAAKTTIATAVDAFFNLTTLLLNTSSTNGAQNNTFLDSSTNNFTITRNGNTTQGTFTPFSQTGWSNFLDGSSHLSSTTAGVGGSGDFTVEAWVFPTITSSIDNPIYDTRGGTGWNLFIPSGLLTLNSYDTTAGVLLGASTNSLTLNAWNHVAFVKSGSNNTYYINGVSSGTYTRASTATPSATKIGSDTGSGKFRGYISNFRTVTSAVYTSGFTPSTTPLTAISGTTLLTCQSNRFVDNSASPITLTANGTPSVQAFSPFAPTAAYDAAVVGGSGYFDGSGDYLVTPSNAAFTFGTGDFTAEAWVYPTSLSASNKVIFDFRAANDTSGYQIGLYSTTTPYVANSGGGILNGTATMAPNAWMHVAVTRASGTLRIFINGVSAGSTSNSLNCTNTVCNIGGNYSGGEAFPGYIANARVVKGTAVYTAAFTPPTALLTAISGTSLLLNATNAGIYDSTAKNVLETVGNAQVSTTQAKWGTTSMAFDGTGDYLKLPSNALYTFGTGAYTIEFWIYPNSLAAGTYHVVGANATNGIIIAINNAKIALNKYGVGDVLAYNTALTTSTWTHVAIVREGTGTNQTKIYVNGTSVATGTDTNDWTVTTNFGVGANTSDGSQGINAYLDDLRITKGYARYTANFTAPTAAFPVQ